ARMRKRRQRRNDFFHSTNLLDLDIRKAECIESFCDLIDYGNILFGNPSDNPNLTHWQDAIAQIRDLETLIILLRLER
ncbi:MAG TPA: hypothetical protein PLZ51_07630, partial [Aggregatilineales bacterium]|nr:hypothetical protein [Aggregatilineales bacterium]